MVNLVYLIASTLAMGFIASAWSSKGGLNLLIKVVFAVLTVWGAGMAVVRLGWVG